MTPADTANDAQVCRKSWGVMVAALLADEPDRPIVELVEELASEEDRLNSLDYGAELSVRAAFALSYGRLPDNLKRLFRLLSVVPGGDVGVVAAGWLISASHTSTSAIGPTGIAMARLGDLSRAERLADFLNTRLRDTESGLIFDGVHKPGGLVDHALRTYCQGVAIGL